MQSSVVECLVALVTNFRATRTKLATLPDPTMPNLAELLNPRVIGFMDPVATLRDICNGLALKTILMRAQISDDAAIAKKIDVLALALMGFTIISEGRCTVAAYPTGAVSGDVFALTVCQSVSDALHDKLMILVHV